MTCSPLFTNPIRCLFVECQEAILNNYNIHINERKQISGVWYLVLRVDSSDYTRIEKGNRSELISTRSGDFISPTLIKLGFSVKIINQKWNVFQCLSFIATSSLSTSFGDTYIPCTVIDAVRPEVTDVASTTRVGRLSVIGTGGTSGNDPDTNAPLYIESYDLVFEEIGKRIVG